MEFLMLDKQSELALVDATVKPLAKTGEGLRIQLEAQGM